MCHCVIICHVRVLTYTRIMRTHVTKTAHRKCYDGWHTVLVHTSPLLKISHTAIEMWGQWRGLYWGQSGRALPKSDKFLHGGRQPLLMDKLYDSGQAIDKPIGYFSRSRTRSRTRSRESYNDDVNICLIGTASLQTPGEHHIDCSWHTYLKPFHWSLILLLIGNTLAVFADICC